MIAQVRTQEGRHIFCAFLSLTRFLKRNGFEGKKIQMLGSLRNIVLFGYKNHVLVDVGYESIMKFDVTEDAF